MSIEPNFRHIWERCIIGKKYIQNYTMKTTDIMIASHPIGILFEKNNNASYLKKICLSILVSIPDIIFSI